jgi:hypothetical protein
MSRPSLENLRMARLVIQYCNATAEEVITYRPLGCDGWGSNDLQLVAFSDSDWACAQDTRRSHGCHIVMYAGGAVSWRSRSHKSVMLSSAAAEYYEASEACRGNSFCSWHSIGFLRQRPSVVPANQDRPSEWRHETAAMLTWPPSIACRPM